VARRARAWPYVLSGAASLLLAAALLQDFAGLPARYALVPLGLGLLAVPPLAAALWWQRKAARSSVRLRQLTARWDLVQRGGQDWTVEFDADATLTRVGPAAAALLGKEPAGLTGENMLCLLDPADRNRLLALLRRAAESKRGWDSVGVRLLAGDHAGVCVNCSAVVRLDGRGRFTGFTASLRRLDDEEAAQAARVLVRERIETVLTERALAIVVQPIFSLETGQVVGVEALSRFASDPEYGPDRWFADAHDVGLGVDLEILAIQTALNQAASLPADCYVSVNVSPATLSSPALRAAVTAGPVAADRIVLELTEHVSVQDYDALIDALAELRARGLRLAIDDAGAGLASFRHILRLRPDLIKIDQAIIRGIDREPAHRALAAALVMFVLEVGSTTIVAEGVETHDELQTVAALGIDAAQGYLLGRPAATKATRWMPLDGLITLQR
jgi:EAL domain-containing protein (putative c-di-GMP-specific phosphodiesterase class I)/PAS domain-containing protein